MAVKTCKKDCSPENKDKFLNEAGMSLQCRAEQDEEGVPYLP